MPRTIVFDVNETLLDLQALNPHFARIFGDADVRRLWFGQVLQNALVMAVTHTYTDFGTVGGAALAMVAEQQGLTLTDTDRTAIRDGMLNLPPHPEVSDSLHRLKDAGLRLVALTNSAQQAAETQLTNAGIANFFERIMSVEGVQRFKPAAEVYQMAADQLGITTAQMRMVAAHNWDITGAMRAGCAGAFVARPGMVIGPLDQVPDIIGPDLASVATQIIEREVELD